jgi:hypothetical protein
MKLIFCFCLLFGALAAADSFASFRSDLRTPPCALWTQADAAFLGKVVAVEKASKSENLPDGTLKIRFQVIENFKGADNPTFTLFEASAATGGAAKLKKGATWIIYARNDIVVKSFTKFAGVEINPKEKSAELETLQSIVAGKTATAIAGRLVSDPTNAKYEFAPVAVVVTGKDANFTAGTDADGAFNIPVPDGAYKVELKFPYRAALKWHEMLLGASNTEGVPTVFRYEVRLNDGDCDFNVFEVTKK